MNQAQRNYLIKKIEEKVKINTDAYKRSEPEAPNLNNYLLHAVMSGNFEIISNDDIKNLITQKALKAKAGDSLWMNNKNSWSSNNEIMFNAEQLFIVPEEYRRLRKEYEEKRDELNEKIRAINIQADSLITRIQLASDKTLQTMINEVDDMGNISLMDSTIKLLSK